MKEKNNYTSIKLCAISKCYISQSVMGIFEWAGCRQWELLHVAEARIIESTAINLMMAFCDGLKLLFS